MESRISIITLGVTDFHRSYTFYKEGLGFKTDSQVNATIAFFKTNGTVLALYPLDKLAEDIDPSLDHATRKFPGITMAHCVKEQGEVETVMHRAEMFGGTIVKPAGETFWGGYAGYFADPDGYYWEVAYYDKWIFDHRGNIVV